MHINSSLKAIDGLYIKIIFNSVIFLIKYIYIYCNKVKSFLYKSKCHSFYHDILVQCREGWCGR